jgi:hypothetical protein
MGKKLRLRLILKGMKKMEKFAKTRGGKVKEPLFHL